MLADNPNPDRPSTCPGAPWLAAPPERLRIVNDCAALKTALREDAPTSGWDVIDGTLQAGADRLAHAPLKRALDLFGAGVGLMLLLPFLAIVAILIAVESRGSPLFVQRRTGYRGAPFPIYKFRTMRVQEDGAAVIQAARDDDRITFFGRLLRRTSIDELPQLLNVLKGDMSLVGPRPHALAHDEFYGARVLGYPSRFLAKPGITGLAQVSGFRGNTARIELMASRVEKDLDYIREWSLMLDIRILFKTIRLVAFDPEAY